MRTSSRSQAQNPLAKVVVALALPALLAVVSQHAAFAQSDTAAAATVTDVPAPSQVQFGFGARARWVSVPTWFLGLFSKENTPLSSSHFGLEFFRRKGDMDVIVGFSYQGMSPPDGNWLGRGKDPRIDTDYVQFRGLSMWSIDAAFVWHNTFNDYLGVHYGAGLGLGIIAGKILRTSAGGNCGTNPSDETQCFPQLPNAATDCPGGHCTEAALQASQGPADGGPTSPHRFKEGSVPGALPILNVMAGLDLRFPQVKGMEIRLLEIGFYNAFFAGMGVSYLF